MWRIVCTAIILFAFLQPGYTQNFNTDSLLRELPKSKEDTNKVNLYRNIGVSLAHQDPAKAISYWLQGVELAKKLQYDMGLTRSYINISTGYSFLGRFDVAMYYCDSAILYCHKIRDTNRLALAYLNKADSYRNLQDFKNALRFCDTALYYADKAGNTDRLARIYDIISDLYTAQNQFDIGIKYLNKALDLYRKDENAVMIGQVYSDFADIYKQTNQHNKAISYYQMAIQIADSVQDLKNMSTYYADIADLYINQGKFELAKTATAKAISFARQQQNDLQLATAYNHLCNLNIKQKNYPEAIKAGLQSYQLSLSENNLLWQKEASTMLAEAYAGAEDHKNAYNFLAISKNLNDSLIRQRFSETSASLQSSFEVKQKDKEIQLLNKDKELKNAQFRQQRVIMITSVIVALMAIVGIALLVNRNKLRQRMKELELRNRIAADLHDEVGSSLSSIHVLSHMATHQKDGLQLNDTLEKINNNAHETMERMSDIVWAIHPSNDSLEQLIFRMKEFASDILDPLDIHYDFVLAADLHSIKLSVSQRRDLYLIFKEAVNNAVKYSQCKNINIRLTHKDNTLVFTISDDGSGFETSAIIYGNGLNNMQQRARQMGGQLQIDSKSEKGTTLILTLKK